MLLWSKNETFSGIEIKNLINSNSYKNNDLNTIDFKKII
jgi:hypothetical protein